MPLCWKQQLNLRKELMEITHEESLENYAHQLRFSIEKYQPHGRKINAFSHVFMGGLGGSGIGARITQSYFADQCPVPMEVVSDYTLPRYVSEKTLVILNSYSGNTEETLSLYEQARERKATIIVLASGGQLLKQAREDGCQTYEIETGYQPRMTIGYSLTYLQLIFSELLDINVAGELEAIAEEMESQQETLIAEATKMFQMFKSTLQNKFVTVCDIPFYQVAVRFCQQLNENSKCEGFVSVLPESNHNVIESYYGKLPTNFVFLRTTLHERVTARFDFVASLLEVANNKVYVIEVPAFDLQAIFELIYVLDWFTIMAAEEKGVDTLMIANIRSLKEYLDQLNQLAE